MKAGVRCDCAACRNGTYRPAAPVPVEENWSDFDPELEAVGVADAELDHGTGEPECPF